MKLSFLTLITFFSVISFKAKAQDVHVSAAVTNSFRASFKQAADVQWSQSDAHYKASFSLNGQAVKAFYDQDGTLVGVTRNLSLVQLPLPLQTSLKDSYEDYWIAELFEVSGNAGVSYFATVENNDTKIVLKSFLGKWSVHKKSLKP